MVINSHYEFPLETLWSFSGFNVHNLLYVIMKSAMFQAILLFSQAITKHRWAKGFTESPSSPLSPYLPLPCHRGHPQLSAAVSFSVPDSRPGWLAHQRGAPGMGKSHCSRRAAALCICQQAVSFLALTWFIIQSPPCQVTKNEPSCHMQLLLCSPYTH